MGLGLGLSLVAGGLFSGGSGTAVVIEDYMWEVHSTSGDGEIKPLALGTVSDFHDTWDLVTLDGVAGHYQPQTIATVGDEGYWDLGASSDTDFIRPIEL